MKSSTSDDGLWAYEAAVIGAVLLDPERYWPELKDEAEDLFSDRKLSLIHAAMRRAEAPPDAVSIKAELQDMGVAHEYGGVLSCLSELMSASLSPAYFDKHLRRVKQAWAARRREEKAKDVMKRLAEGEDREELIAEYREAIAGLGPDDLPDTVQHSHELADDVFASARERKRERQEEGAVTMTGLPTGYPKLDSCLDGLCPGSVYVLAARPSVGKSSLMSNIALRVAGDENPCQMVSLEMEAEELVRRMAAVQAKLSLSKIRRGELSESQLRQLERACERIKDSERVWVTGEQSDIASVRKSVQEMVTRHGVEMLAIDYINLMTDEEPGNRNLELGKIARELKLLAQELQIPVLTLAQLNRNIAHNDGEPELHHLRDSGEIEQHADVVMFLVRDGEGPGITEDMRLKIAKNRNGPTAAVPVRFWPPQTRFAEIAEDEHE